MLNKLRLTSAQFIAIGYLVTILLGSFLLTLPISSKGGEWTPYINSFFTSTSATCVTGLVIYDTFTHWSIFGQLVILSLIQIGGIGFMTIITLFAMFLKKRIGLKERKLIMETSASTKISGVVDLIKKIALGTLIFETAGTLILATRFCQDMGFVEGMYNAVFHSISAFCNAGFDIMGSFGEFSSLTHYSGDIVINLTIMILVIVGGLGFIVWNDVFNLKFNIKKYQLHTKMVLTATSILLLVSTAMFFIFERNYSMKDMNTGNAILASMFQAVTPRTAGFSTIDIATLSDSGHLYTMLMMFIGGSPGSTAGGIKTTTFLVIVMGIVATTKHSKHIDVFKYSLEERILRQASTIAAVYLAAIITGTLLICMVQDFSFKDVIFETTSALGTVGLSTGITPNLNTFSKLIIILLMYGGRVGALSLVLVFTEKTEPVPLSRPIRKVIVG